MHRTPADKRVWLLQAEKMGCMQPRGSIEGPRKKKCSPKTCHLSQSVGPLCVITAFHLNLKLFSRTLADLTSSPLLPGVDMS
jgi:hypothetical protein